MTDLFEQVFKHIEGNDETVTQCWQTVEGTRPVEVPKYGPALWIEDVHQKHRMAAIDCLALILFVLDDFVAKEQARRIVEGWAAELRKAVSTDEIQARDPVTLLALETLPDGWEWLLSMADADKFIAARGMEWRFGEVALHLFRECEQAIQNRRYPPWARTTPAQNTAPPAPGVAVSAAGGVELWKEKARVRAFEIIKRDKEKDLYPSQDDIADEIAKQFRRDGLTGADGKPLSGATIKRHALKGISSAIGKQLSTTIGRGK